MTFMNSLIFAESPSASGTHPSAFFLVDSDRDSRNPNVNPAAMLRNPIPRSDIDRAEVRVENDVVRVTAEEFQLVPLVAILAYPEGTSLTFLVETVVNRIVHFILGMLIKKLSFVADGRVVGIRFQRPDRVRCASEFVL